MGKTDQKPDQKSGSNTRGGPANFGSMLVAIFHQMFKLVRKRLKAEIYWKN